MNFDRTVTTEKSFDEAVKAIERETKKAGFRVLYPRRRLYFGGKKLSN